MRSNHHSPVLAVDTLGDVLSASIFHNERIFNQSIASKKHANAITELVASLCENAKITPKDLTLLVVNIGPGSFTGLRIGIGTIQAMAHALNIPILPLENSLCLAYHAFFTKFKKQEVIPSHFATLIDARLSQVYFSIYSINPIGHLLPTVKDSIFNYSKIPFKKQYSENLFRCGDAWNTYADKTPSVWHEYELIKTELGTESLGNCILYPDVFSNFYSRSHIMIAIFLHIHGHLDNYTIQAKQLKANYVRDDVAKKKHQD